MKRGKKTYTGKSNVLYEVIDDNGRVDDSILEMEFTNRVSVDDGEKRGVIDGKGYVNNLMSTLLFQRFEEAGIPTHYVSQGTTPCSQFIRRANIIPLEVIGRNYTAGDFCKRYGVEEGKRFRPMLLEFTYKNDELHDPLITKDVAVALGIVKKKTIETIKNYTRVINDEASLFFENEFGLTLVDFMLSRFNGIVQNLVVHEKNMLKNTDRFGGIVFSQKVLLELVEKGLTREEAYRIVQRNALDAFENDGDFKANLMKDKDVTDRLTSDEIEKIFDSSAFLSNINTIYKRIL